MTRINAFLNVQILNSPPLAGYGDKCLWPVRYLFRGKIAWINQSDDQQEVFHTSAFHYEKGHQCRIVQYKKLIEEKEKLAFPERFSAEQHDWMKTALAILAFIPGLILGSVLKGVSYCISQQFRNDYRLVKQHFIPIHHWIIEDEKNLKVDTKEISKRVSNFLKNGKMDSEKLPLHPKVNILTIRSKNDLKLDLLNSELLRQILALHPKKIILDVPFSNIEVLSAGIFKLMSSPNYAYALAHVPEVDLQTRSFFANIRPIMVYQVTESK